MPLQGTFDVLDFTEVLRLMARQQLTGRLHVRSRSFGANLFLEDGLVVGADQSEHQPAATAGDVRGRIEEICFEMLEAERGSFEFQPGKPSAIAVGERYRAETVLGRARKRLDEWHELQEAIPSLDLQPRLVLDLSSAEVTLDKERWRMLTTIDGRRNLRAIGRALNLSDFDVCRVVRSLLNDGIVELDGLAALPASTRDAMPTVPGPPAASLEGVFGGERGGRSVAVGAARAARSAAAATPTGSAESATGQPAPDDEPDRDSGPGTAPTAALVFGDGDDPDELGAIPLAEPPSPLAALDDDGPTTAPGLPPEALAAGLPAVDPPAASAPGTAGAEAPDGAESAAEHAEDAEGSGSARRGRRVIRIRSRHAAPEGA